MDKGIRIFQEMFANESHEIFRDANRRVAAALVRNSPVDEGEFVAEWEGAVNNSMPPNPERAMDPSKTVTRARLKITSVKAQYGDTVYYQNLDPIGSRLEFGYSDQAPQGITRLVARKWKGFVRGAGRAAQNRVKKRIVNQ